MGRLFWKIFLGFWLALVAVAAGTGTAVWLERRARDGGGRELAIGRPHRVATDMAAATLRHGGIEALREWMADARSDRPVPLLAVDRNGQELLGRAVPEAALAHARTVVAGASDGQGARLVAAPSGETYLLFVPLAAAPRLPPPPPPPAPTWMLVAIGGIASLGFSALLAWYLARPIRNLRWAFEAAAAGRLETRVGPLMGRRRDEIADLGRDFDRMARQLQSLVAAQKRLLHDVSHELRSPLARLQAAIGLVRQSPDKLGASLDRIEREVARLDEMVGEVLVLARLETGAEPRGSEVVDLAHLVASIAEDARFEARAADRDVAICVHSDVLVMGRPELLHRAVENVVRNALKYTDRGTTVAIDLLAQKDTALLTVTDHGPGVAQEDLARIFEPFYRGSAGERVEGFGLGLAIARHAILAHDGSIRAANVESGGLRVEIALPSFTAANAT